MSSPAELAIMQSIHRDAAVPRNYIDPKILIEARGPRPYYYLKVPMPIAGPKGVETKRRRVLIGLVDEVTLSQAKEMKAQIIGLLNGKRFALQSQLTFAALAEKFFETHLPTLQHSTQEKYHCHLRNHLLPAFGKLQLGRIDKAMVQAWLNKMTCSSAMKDDLRNLLKTTFKLAREWKYWDGDNPANGIKARYRRAVREKDDIPHEGLIRFLAALHDTAICSGDDARLMVLTALIGGLRVSEVLGLKVSDVDVAAETVRVQRAWVRGYVNEECKSDNARRVRQVGRLAGELARTGRGKTFIFGRTDGINPAIGDPPDDRDLQQHVFRPALEAAGVYKPGVGIDPSIPLSQRDVETGSRRASD
jgi:integrase